MAGRLIEGERMLGGFRRYGGAAVVGLTLLLTGSCAGDIRPADQPSAVESQQPRPAPRPAAGTPSAPVAPLPPGRKPNIVLVLMDDFSLDLWQTMKVAQEMERRGASYSRAFVVDSLCCVSRASLLTGQYPHQTGVRTNTANTPNPVGPIGGWEAFTAYGNEERSVNVALQEAGYRTGYVGKYLNQYEPSQTATVPAGWDTWNVLFGSAYDGWGFESSFIEDDGSLGIIEHPAPPASAPAKEKDAAYAGTVVADLALDFIEEHEAGQAPYFLEVAPFAPHSRVGPDGAYPGDPLFPPAFGDRPGPRHPDGNCGAVSCQDLTLDDLPGFGDSTLDNTPVRDGGFPALPWRTNTPRLTPAEAVGSLRSRAQMVQSVDRMLARVLEAVGDDTYVVLTSDNGFHLGQHGLERGKGTPYDSDVRVPLVVVGPGVVPGDRDTFVTNLDLAPTFEQLAGLHPAAYRSGLSLRDSLERPRAKVRDRVFFEHTFAPSLGGDPDRAYAGGTMDLIPSYVAVRGEHGLLVRVDTDPSWEGTSWAWEFYDYRLSAQELVNGMTARASRPLVAKLRKALDRYDACAVHVRDDRVPQRCRF